MGDSKDFVQRMILQGEVRDLKLKVQDLESQLQASRLLNAQLVDRYTTDIGKALKEKQTAEERLQKLRDLVQVISLKVDKQKLEMTCYKRMFYQQVTGKDTTIGTLEAELDSKANDIQGLTNDLCQLRTEVDAQKAEFASHVAAVKEEHQRQMLELEANYKAEVEKVQANSANKKYSCELKKMWEEMELLKAVAAKAAQEAAQATARNQPRDTEMSCTSSEVDTKSPSAWDVTQKVVSTGHLWKAELHIGPAKLDLGSWDAKEDAERTLARSLYKLLGRTCEEHVLSAQRKAKLDAQPTLEFFYRLRKREKGCENWRICSPG